MQIHSQVSLGYDMWVPPRMMNDAYGELIPGAPVTFRYSDEHSILYWCFPGCKHESGPRSIHVSLNADKSEQTLLKHHWLWKSRADLVKYVETHKVDSSADIEHPDDAWVIFFEAVSGYPDRLTWPEGPRSSITEIDGRARLIGYSVETAWDGIVHNVEPNKSMPSALDGSDFKCWLRKAATLSNLFRTLRDAEEYRTLCGIEFKFIVAVYRVE